MSTVYGTGDNDGLTLDAALLRHFHIFKTPAADFDVRTASDRHLVVHGLPARPDSQVHPRLATKWDRVAALRLEFITPELRTMPSRRRALDRDLIVRRSIADLEIARYHRKATHAFAVDRLVDVVKLWQLIPETSTNWSGAYVKRPNTEPLVSVTGEWTVPGVNPPASAWNGTGYNDGTYLCGVWVGIDGTQGTGDVMQAGTASQCVVAGGKMISTRFFAWIEWFSLPSVAVVNFPVQVGDLISCTVCAPFGNTHGSALFNNLTSGATTNVGIDPPAGTSLVGNVAEWIVEDPGMAGGGLFPFPNYGSTHFTDCSAGSQNIELDLNAAKVIDLVDASNTVLSSAYIESNRTLFCRYGTA
jgi:hypothetical protein